MADKQIFVEKTGKSDVVQFSLPLTLHGKGWENEGIVNVRQIMAILQFKGKQFVQNYHFTVPHHTLKTVAAKGFPKGKTDLDDNLIVHGDNLKALKSLLPKYGGQVKCIYIDPPYNTGNEGWAYSDNVNSPMMREWLGKEVGRDDLTRHDKWLCMMMPRLKLLRELLRDDGVIFISIDDNEVHHLRMLMDEVFGEGNLVQEIVWKNKYGPGAMTKAYGNVHEYILCYSKNPIDSVEAPLSEDEMENYKTRDDKFEKRGGYITQPLMTRSKDDRPNLVYPLKYEGKTIMPDKQWIWERKRLERAIKNNEVVFNKDDQTGKWSVRFKQYLKDENGIIRKGKPISVSIGPFNQEGSWEIEELFGDKTIFNNPKPSALVKKLLSIQVNGKPNKDSIILDSFAGSGTTAHAVMALNKEDGGKRKFILIECEEYADKITAERVRRVIKGVSGAKDENLKKGLGGSFAYAELGEAIEADGILSGKRLPSYLDMARHVFFTATGKNIIEKQVKEKTGFIGETDAYQVYLFYRPDLAYLKTTALNFERAQALPKRAAGKMRLVFAPAKYLDEEALDDFGIEFAQLPFGIYRRI